MKQSIPFPDDIATLTEIDPTGAAIRLDPAARRHLHQIARDHLAAAVPAGTERLVLCFETSWQAIPVTWAAMRVASSVQPWQFSGGLGDRGDLQRRCASLRGLTPKPVLVTSPKLHQMFLAEDLEPFATVVVIDLPSAPGPNTRPCRDTAAPAQARILVETGGTARPPRLVALSGGDVQARAGLAAEPAAAVRLEVANFDTGAGIERILGGSSDLIVVNGDLAARDPAVIADSAAKYGATVLQLSPGHVARLLRALDGSDALADLGALDRLVVSGGLICLPEVVALADRLRAAGAKRLAVQFDYRTTECGLIASTGPVGAAGLAATVGQGANVTLGRPVGDTEIRVVTPKFQPLGQNEIGQIQARRASGVATYFVEPDGALTRLGHATGWIDTNDVGFLDAAGLTITSRKDAQIAVPRRVFQIYDIERRLRGIRGLRPEMLAAFGLRPAGSNKPMLAVCFCALDNTPEEVARLSADLFSAVVGFTGVQPVIYHCSQGRFPMSSALAVKRQKLRNMILSGVLTATAQPRVAFDQPDLLSRAELQQRVAECWQNILQLDAPPDHREDFFALGGDSLNLATMLTEIEAMFLQTIDIEVFFREPTIEGLCASLQTAASQAPVLDPAFGEAGGYLRKIAAFTSTWRGEKAFADSLVRGVNTDGAKPPLFWVFQSEPEALKLAAALGPDQPIYAMRSAVGVTEHYGQDALEEISNRYLWEILAAAKGRAAFLGGNCQGGIIALSLARRLQQIGQDPMRLILMDWFFDFGGYTGATAFLTGEDSFVAELQQSRPELTKLQDIFPRATFASINGTHGRFFQDEFIAGVAEGIRAALVRDRQVLSA